MKRPLQILTTQSLSTDGATPEADAIAALNREKLARGGRGFTAGGQSQDSPAPPSTAGSIRVTDNAGAETAHESSSTPPPAPEPAAPALTADQVNEMIRAALASAAPAPEPEPTEADQIAELQRQVEEANAAARRAESERQSLIQTFGLDRFTGNSAAANQVGFPNVNRTTTVSSDRPPGAIAEYLSHVAQQPRIRRLTERAGQVIAHDTSKTDPYIRDNFRQVVKDLESWGRSFGLFQGPNNVAQTDAATTISDLPGAFLETLSAVMRANNRPAFVFWQFADSRFDFQARRGTTIDVPRAAYLPGPATTEDRLLSGGGTYFPIDGTRQRLQTGIREITLKEYGLGKDSTAPPVRIPTFVEAYSMIDLMVILDRNLWHDYYSFEDLAVVELWEQTSRIIYNNGGEVTATVGDLAANDDGTFTEEFAHSLRGYADELQFVPFRDGCPGVWLNPRAKTQFKKSLGDRWHPPTVQDQEDFTNMLSPDILTESGRVTNYLGKWCDLHMFSSNNYGVSSRGVQTETVASASRTTRSSFLFGASTVGHGVGMAAEIRRETADFQRANDFIWLAHEGWDALDIDPTGFSDTDSVPQQLRVIEIHTLDVAI